MLLLSTAMKHDRTAARFCVSGGDEHILILVLLSAAYPANGTRMSYRIYFQLLYLTSASVSGSTFSKCPAERKASDVSGHCNETPLPQRKHATIKRTFIFGLVHSITNHKNQRILFNFLRVRKYFLNKDTYLLFVNKYLLCL